MGEAFDKDGYKLGEATGATRGEVLKELEQRFGDSIAEVRIQRRPKMTPVEEIENRFRYHKPFGNQSARYVAIRTAAKVLASLIHSCCPDSREKSTAQTNVQQAVMWANASIAINEQEPEPAVQTIADQIGTITEAGNVVPASKL